MSNKLNTKQTTKSDDKNVLLESFKNREIKAKSIFSLSLVSKSEAYNFVKKHHYLKDAKFFCVYAVGMFFNNEMVGVATFSNPQGISTLKGWFGLTNDCKDVLELSRLCLMPILNGTNATSYLLSNSLKILKKENGIRAVITLADDDRHVGSIYQVCNFKYFGLTDKKTDFYTHDGKVNPRGETKNIRGVWLPRNRKHRYCYVMDCSLKVLYLEQPKPSKKVHEFCEVGEVCSFCENGVVYDKRFSEWHPCPKCNSK